LSFSGRADDALRLLDEAYERLGDAGPRDARIGVRSQKMRTNFRNRTLVQDRAAGSATFRVFALNPEPASGPVRADVGHHDRERLPLRVHRTRRKTPNPSSRRKIPPCTKKIEAMKTKIQNRSVELHARRRETPPVDRQLPLRARWRMKPAIPTMLSRVSRLPSRASPMSLNLLGLV
jgi:hypothetical protein